MANILETLDDKLQQFWLEQETKKTWDEWGQWLKDLDCPLNLDRPLDVPDRPFSFRTWLSASEPQLSQHSDWMTRLTTPAWLQRQQVTILPNLLKSGNTAPPALAEVGALQVELTRLIDQIHMVQQRMGHLEASSKQTQSTPQRKPMPAAPVINPPLSSGQQMAPQQVIPQRTVPNQVPAGRAASPMGRPDLARTLDRELQIVNSSVSVTSTSFSDEVENEMEPEIVPLKEAYLSFNSWCSQFEDVHLNLQEFVNGELKVPSSHMISYRQFNHRIMRTAKDPKELSQVMDTFARLRKDGVDININNQEMEIPADENLESPEELETEEGFKTPSLEEYKNFNAWLDWLRAEGIDPDQYASQKLGNSSSHQISFPQFCRRLERALDDVVGFRNAVSRE